MSRNLASLFKTALGDTVLYVSLFAEFQFDSGTTRFWSGEANISADLGDGAVTWLGGSILGNVSLSGEGETIEARQLVFQLNGASQAYYSVAIATNYRGRPARLWFALTNSAGTAVSYYYLLEEARMDTLTINEDEDTLTLTLTCESRLLDMFTPNRVVLTNDEMAKEHPGDLFYSYTPTLPGKRMPWGITVSGATSPTSGGGGGGEGGGGGGGGGLPPNVIQ